MKVLYSRTNFWFGLKAGGSVGHTIGVLEGLRQLGEVEIVSNAPLYGVDNVPIEIVKPVGKSWAGELLYNLYFAPCLADKIRSFRPDFVYHRYNGYSFATAAVCQRLGVPLVLEFNSSELWKLRYWSQNKGLKHKLSWFLKKPILALTEPFNLQSATLTVVVSDPLKRSLVSMGFPPNRILVNPNGVNAYKFKPSPPDVCSRIKQELGISPDKIVVGFSGTFGKWHGIPELTKAILQLNADPYWCEVLFFVLYGDGELGPMMQERIGHFNNVCLTGIVQYKHIQDYLSICDILLSPHGKTPDARKFFGSPTKLFEYMAMGKGIVASNLAQIGEVLDNAHTAVLVEPGNVDELVNGILKLANDENLRERLGNKAREEVIANYTWQKNVERVINKLKMLL